MSAPIGRTLAVDLGSRRTGLAVCDALGIAIRTLPAVVSSSAAERLEGVLAAAAAEDSPRVLIGLPLHMDGGESRGARDAREFGAALAARRADLEVAFADERLTTIEAADLLAEVGVRRDRQRGRIDSTAAAVLLRAWIDARRAERAAEAASSSAADDSAAEGLAAEPEPPYVGRDHHGRATSRRRPRR